MENITLDSIKQAKQNFWDFIKTSPLEFSDRLSQKYNAEIYLKREDLQSVRSYKIRWAFNKINSLSEQEKKMWVVCASAGNHAQGVAITCNKLKIKGTIYMPVTTPEQKVYKTKKFGWEFVDVVLVWDTFDEALVKSFGFQKNTWATFIHPFDDYKTIEWQATVSLEIFEQLKSPHLIKEGLGVVPDYIICPIGWGWFISWQIIAKNYLNPETEIIWAEPIWASWMKKSLELWKNTTLENIDIFVDWAAVWREWEIPFDICKKENIEIISCPENRICTTILDYLKEDWIVVEPAWALATDALKDLKEKIKWKKVVVIISGSNFDFERLPEVKERSLKFEWLKKYYLINFPQRPWALKDFLNCLWEEDDIERFEYLKKSAKNTAPVFIWLKTENPKNWEKIEKKMTELWFKYNDVTNDEMYFNLLV